LPRTPEEIEEGRGRSLIEDLIAITTNTPQELHIEEEAHQTFEDAMDDLLAEAEAEEPQQSDSSNHASSPLDLVRPTTPAPTHQERGAIPTWATRGSQSNNNGVIVNQPSTMQRPNLPGHLFEALQRELEVLYPPSPVPWNPSAHRNHDSDVQPPSRAAGGNIQDENTRSPDAPRTLAQHMLSLHQSRLRTRSPPPPPLQRPSSIPSIYHPRRRDNLGRNPIGLDVGDRPPPIGEKEMMVKLECAICFQQKANVVCLPCGHTVMCQWYGFPLAVPL
jgi:C3HC4-type zinc finger (RING finger) protein